MMTASLFVSFVPMHPIRLFSLKLFDLGLSEIGDKLKLQATGYWPTQLADTEKLTHSHEHMDRRYFHKLETIKALHL